MSDLEIANRLTPDQPEVLADLGLCYLRQNEITNALAAFDQAIDLDPENPNLYFQRGNTYRLQSNYSAAIEDYTESIQLNGISVDVFNNRGITYMDSGQYDLAQQDFQKAITLNPQYLLALINSSLIYIQTNEPQKATDQLNTVLKNSSDYPQVYDYRAQAYFLLKDFDLAILDWKKFAEVQGENPITLNWIGRCFIAKMQYQDAIDYFDEAIRLDPVFGEAYYQKGLANVQLKRYEEAIPLFDKALDLGSNTDLSYFNRGVARYNTGKKESAITDFQKVLDISENPELIAAAQDVFSSLGIQPKEVD